jgi:hypothetical protein
MKTPDQVTADISRYLGRTWAATLTDPASAQWPRRFPLGPISQTELAGPFENIAVQVQRWSRWLRQRRAAGIEVDLHTASRRIAGTSQTIPTHLTVHSINAAAQIAADGWPAQIILQQARSEVLARRFAQLSPEERARTLREVGAYSPADFELLCDAANWFQTHSATGLTPRQVPIPGLHAKWLNTSQHLIKRLAGIETLGLIPAHPIRVHITYLDPAHRAAGGRLHDVAAVGDTMLPAYNPRLIIISENKDTAVGFPLTAGAIAIEGDGYAGPLAISQLNWVRDCSELRYWGDIDAEGFEIVNSYRAAGLPVRTLLMDCGTYEKYKTFGSYYDRKGNRLDIRSRRDLPLLTESERQTYSAVTDPSSTEPPRLEQERIPLGDAVVALQSSIALTNTNDVGGRSTDDHA